MTEKLTPDQIDTLRKKYDAEFLRRKVQAEKSLSILTDLGPGTTVESHEKYRTERRRLLKLMKPEQGISKLHAKLMRDAKKKTRSRWSKVPDGKVQKRLF